MSSNKRRKLDILDEDNQNASNYSSINLYEEFILTKKNSGMNFENLLNAKEETNENSILEYSQILDVNNYDDYPDLLSGGDIMGNQIIDFGVNELPNNNNMKLIEYKSIEFKEFIGEGNFSDVWSGRIDADIEDEKAAIKVLKPSKEKNTSLDTFMNELEILSTLNKDENPYVLKLYGYCKTPHLCIITELMDLSLYDLIHKESNEYLDSHQNQIKLAVYIARGINGINEKSSILHNDITSKNILLKYEDDSSHYIVKITDFGLSCFIDSKNYPTKRANARWRSPEQTLSNTFSKKGEVWSFGVIFWEILTKKLPYHSTKESKVVSEGVANQSLSLEIPSSLPAFVKDLLNDCLVYDPDQRASISDVVSVLENYYFDTFQEQI
eukprot:TRINITY_DN632_c0_g2_i1.p1 TRINITY_DN632_c0_g2~~TRINITY_DN632_c0_g2_i1.p1  ORF type:complete len:383 (+),score=127.21 TRINITY_DN632_c0_g2_i1:178-1326(+)